MNIFSSVAQVADPVNIKQWRVERILERRLTITKFDNLETALLFVKEVKGKRTRICINDKTVTIQ